MNPQVNGNNDTSSGEEDDDDDDDDYIDDDDDAAALNSVDSSSLSSAHTVGEGAAAAVQSSSVGGPQASSVQRQSRRGRSSGTTRAKNLDRSPGYRANRDKNNKAAKKSRETKRRKHLDTIEDNKKLTTENQCLRGIIDQFNQLIRAMPTMLEAFRTGGATNGSSLPPDASSSQPGQGQATPVNYDQSAAVRPTDAGGATRGDPAIHWQALAAALDAYLMYRPPSSTSAATSGDDNAIVQSAVATAFGIGRDTDNDGNGGRDVNEDSNIPPPLLSSTAHERLAPHSSHLVNGGHHEAEGGCQRLDDNSANRPRGETLNSGDGNNRRGAAHQRSLLNILLTVPSATATLSRNSSRTNLASMSASSNHISTQSQQLDNSNTTAVNSNFFPLDSGIVPMTRAMRDNNILPYCGGSDEVMAVVRPESGTSSSHQGRGQPQQEEEEDESAPVMNGDQQKNDDDDDSDE